MTHSTPRKGRAGRRDAWKGRKCVDKKKEKMELEDGGKGKLEI